MTSRIRGAMSKKPRTIKNPDMMRSITWYCGGTKLKLYQATSAISVVAVVVASGLRK